MVSGPILLSVSSGVLRGELEPDRSRISFGLPRPNVPFLTVALCVCPVWSGCFFLVAVSRVRCLTPLCTSSSVWMVIL